MTKNISGLLAALFLVCGLQACTASSPVTTRPESRPAWPPPPLEAKIEWVDQYQILENSSTRSGLWGGVKDFFLGPEEAHLVRPYGVTTDNRERLFIADTGGQQVYILNRRTEQYSAFAGTEQCPLSSPIGLQYVDDSLFITDSAAGQVVRYDLADQTLHCWGENTFLRPTGITYDPASGLLYIADSEQHEIIAVDRAGTEKFRFGGRGSGAGEFNFPTDLWLDRERRLYVTDALNARIQAFAADGSYLWQFGKPGDTPGSFAKPKGVAVDSHGHVFVCDALFDAVQIFGPRGRTLMAFGDNGSRPGQFWMPSGIHIDSANRIYVTDTYNQRIQIFRIVE